MPNPPIIIAASPRAGGGGSSSSSSRNKKTTSDPAEVEELSTYMTIVLVFVTHGLINSFLLAFSPIRCAFWNRHKCNADEAWAIVSLTHSR